MNQLADVESNTENRGQIAGVQLLYKTFRIIDAVAEAETPLKTQEIVVRTGLSRGTVYRVLQALCDERYLEFDSTAGTYRLGTRVFDLAHTVWDRFDLRGAAEPELSRLAAVSGLTVRLAVLSQGDVLYVDQREARGEVRIASGVGNRVSPHASACGKAILAYLGPADRDDALSRIDFVRLTDKTIGDLDTLRRELDLTKARGYAVCVEERTNGLVSMAAPILNTDRQPVGALGIVAQSELFGEMELITFGHDLMEAARRIAGNAGDAPQTIEPAARPKQIADPELKVLASEPAFLGESPIWLDDEKALYWVDMLAPSLNRTDLAGETRKYGLPKITSAILPTADGLLLLAQDSMLRVDSFGQPPETILDYAAEMHDARFNDAKADALGRIWAGTLQLDPLRNLGTIMRIDKNGASRVLEHGLTVPNGLDWSPDGRRLYFADSAAHSIWTCPFEPQTGEIDTPEVLIRINPDHGRPGGLTVDTDGFLWVAHWDGWRVARYAPDGRLDRTVFLPLPRPTSCCFGGEDMKTLFITTSRIRLSSQQLLSSPLSGSVLYIETQSTGKPHNKALVPDGAAMPQP